MRLILSLLILHLGMQTGVAQPTVDSSKNDDLVTKQLRSIVVEGQVRQVFSTLALKHDIPIGLELDNRGPDLSDYRLELAHGTLPELLDQFVRQNGRYTWLIENGVVNIFPRYEERDPFLAELLSVRIKQFGIKKRSSADAVRYLLCNSPEIKALMDARGIKPDGLDLSGFFIPQLGREFSLVASDLTTKEILNQIVSNSPVARIWIVSREQPVGTLNVTVNARLEVETHEIEAPNINLLFSKLADQFGVPITLEVALGDDLLGSKPLLVYVKKGGLAAALDYIVEQQPSYTWISDEGTIRVFPKPAFRDPLLPALLATKIRRFVIPQRTTRLTVKQALANRPELKDLLASNGVQIAHESFSSYEIQEIGRDFSLDLQDSTVQAILDYVLNSSQTKYWFIRRSGDSLFINF